MALEYPYDSHPAPGTTREVAEGVRWLTMPMGGSLTHINLYKGVICTHMHPDHTGQAGMIVNHFRCPLYMMESHDKFLDTPENTFVLPAHNLPFYGVRERLRDLISHHEDRMLAIEETCVAPQTAKDPLPVLFKRKLDARQTMMALGEAIARDLGEDGRYRFRSIDPDLDRRAHPGRHDAPDDQPIMV